MNKKETGLNQRFSNFEKTVKLLERTLQITNPSEAEKAGLVKFYEMTLELAWKTLKDYLEDQGFMVKFPRDVIKQAFQVELIDNGEIWMKMLKKRNLLAYTYNESLFYEALEDIKHEYYPEIKKLYTFLKNE
jgi:nucleotidyltransferase substrate binding protein (TIGR01987 family)